MLTREEEILFRLVELSINFEKMLQLAPLKKTVADVNDRALHDPDGPCGALTGRTVMLNPAKYEEGPGRICFICLKPFIQEYMSLRYLTDTSDFLRKVTSGVQQDITRVGNLPAAFFNLYEFSDNLTRLPQALRSAGEAWVKLAREVYLDVFKEADIFLDLKKSESFLTVAVDVQFLKAQLSVPSTYAHTKSTRPADGTIVSLVLGRYHEVNTGSILVASVPASAALFMYSNVPGSDITSLYAVPSQDFLQEASTYRKDGMTIPEAFSVALAI